MKTKQLVLTVALASAFSLQPSALVCAAPLDSAISYQGRLADGPNPASGSYDLRFSLHTAASGPQLGTAITNAATLVTNGLFTVTLDFGGGLFTGEARWLEIGVRTSGGAGDFTTLTPRQPLTAAPYALYAPTAGSAATATTAASVPAAGITGTLPDGLLSTNVVLMDYGNISANAISANTFWGNAIGLTNLNSSNLTGDLTVAGGFMTERSRWFNGYGANDAVLVGSYLDPDSLLYLANGPELRILDVRNESAPICVGYYNLTNGALLGLAVSGHYAYAACGVEGLRIFDVATPTNIVNVGHIDDDGGAGYAWAVAVVGNYAYLANHADGVRIYDVSNPAAPALVAHINDGGEARDVFVYPPYPQVWQHIYVANGPDGLRIYDVTTPASPTNLAHIPTTYHARAVCVDQHINLGVPIAYVAEYSQVEMVQVQYPAAAYVVGTIHSHGYVSDVKVKGTEVFLSSDHNGAGGHLEVVSVLDTSHIRTTCEISSLLPMRAVAVDPGRQFLYGANDVGGLVTYQVVRTGTATAPFFQGDGRLLGNLDASHLTSGTLPDARLSGTYSSALTLNNRDNDVHGAFTGDGSQITNLNVASLTGTLADARLSSNVALLNTNQTFTGSNTFSSVLTATNAGNVLNGTLTGNLSGNATTATTAGDFTGSLSGDVTGTQDATVVSTVSGQSAANVASGAVAANAATSANTASTIVKRGASGEFSAGDITASNVTGSFTGGGSGLTNVNAHHLEGQPASAFAAAGHAHDFINLLGTVADAQLSGNVALLNTNQTFTGSNIFSSVLTATNAGNVLSGTLTGSLVGDGAGVTNVNAGTLGGQDAAFYQSAANLNAGTLADARLSSNVALLNTNQTFTGSNIFSSVLTATNAGNVLNGTLTGSLSGNATTATTAGNFTGSLSGDVTGTQGATVVSTVSGQSAANVASGAVAANAATSANTASTIVKRGASGEFSAGDIAANSFTGDGANLTNLNAASLASGTILDARLAGNVARTNQVWLLNGNLATTPGTQFLGTTDNQPLEFKVNNLRALRLEPGTTSPNLVGGHSGNLVDSGFVGAVISGGGNALFINRISASFASIGGGLRNMIQTNASYATIGGGLNNTIQSNAVYATIPGGSGNGAGGICSFAAGQSAKAVHDYSFVWNDGSSGELASTATNSVTLRASGGFRLFSGGSTGVILASGGGSWTSMSDRNAKESFSPVDAQEMLAKVTALPLSTWNYKSQNPGIRHIGPMAQDFKAAFGVGESDTGITTIDADGVALAAIQGLNQKLEAENAELKARLAKLEQLITGKNGGGQ